MPTAKDVMTTNVITMDPNATVAEAMERIRQVGIRCLIVERDTPGASYGIVTQRDIAYRVIAVGLDPSRVRVRHIMTRPLVTVNGDMTLHDVARLMKTTGLSRVPVISDGELQGIVSISDILAAA
ncbi:MAG TPA: CBS domain-containing protein [Armatimonadota bacterium]|nr:CBS domain-containing protein [Armatimonadota bacterium]